MSTNLISNPGFENGITPWTLAITDQNVNTAALVTTGAYSGSRCVRLTSNNAGQAYVAQTVVLTAGHNYSLSFYAKRTGNIDVWTGYTVDNVHTPLPSLMNKIGSAYTKVTQNIALSGSGAKSVGIYIIAGSAAGEAWIDSVELIDNSMDDDTGDTGDTGVDNEDTEIVITGNGHNSTITLAKIHAGEGSFRKDTSTTHSQVALMQQALTDLGYNTQGADGKFGNNTLSAVKAFQNANNLTMDGYFGKNSLNALETALGRHLDPVNCNTPYNDGNTGGSSSSSAYDKIKETSVTYKTMQGTRVDNYNDVLARINSFAGEGTPLTVEEYFANLDALAANPAKTYDILDCSGYVKSARNGQGYHGSTTNFNQHCKYYGYIPILGGYDKLVPGMELYQGYRKNATDLLYYTSHVGVYAGLHDFGDGKGPVHAVYQSSPRYENIAKEYTKNIGDNGYRNGPNLTSMTSAWNYWGWSKYVKVC